MRPPRLPLRLLPTVLTLSFIAFPTAARAQCDVSARSGATTSAGPSGPVVASEPTPFGSFSATADFGALSVSATVSLPENASDGGVNAIAEFDDQLTITAPGVPQFTPGTLTAVVQTVGTPDVTQSATGPGVAQGMGTSYQLFLSKNGGTAYLLNGGVLYNDGTEPRLSVTGTVPAPGVEEIDISFSFGVPFTLGGFLLATAGGSNIIPVGASGTISGTTNVSFDWLGLSSVRETAGPEHLAVATVASCSGFDWVGDVASTSVSLGPTDDGSAPRLAPSFPNPFRAETTIAYSVAVGGPVTIELFDVAGRRVRTLVSASQPAGTHRVTWNGDADAGRPAAAGIYFVRLTGRGGTDRQKLVVLD